MASAAEPQKNHLQHGHSAVDVQGLAGDVGGLIGRQKGHAGRHFLDRAEAAHRLALGRDPGIVPERFLIPAARLALDGKLAAPGTITRHFYDALGRR